jgi:hypothetical protein
MLEMSASSCVHHYYYYYMILLSIGLVSISEMIIQSPCLPREVVLLWCNEHIRQRLSSLMLVSLAVGSFGGS